MRTKKGGSIITPDEYQRLAHSFAFYTKPAIVEESNLHGSFKTAQVKATCDFVYPCLGLAEETGELNGKFAKIIRDKRGIMSEEDITAISKEIGDCLWMIAEICTVLNLTMSEVMIQNIQKLEDRRNRNVLSGSGDNR